MFDHAFVWLDIVVVLDMVVVCIGILYYRENVFGLGGGLVVEWLQTVQAETRDAPSSRRQHLNNRMVLRGGAVGTAAPSLHLT